MLLRHGCRTTRAPCVTASEETPYGARARGMPCSPLRRVPTKAANSSSAKPISVKRSRKGGLRFRCQKHCRSTKARNSVSTKLTIAVGSCLKAWSRPQWVEVVLKQPFSISQRQWPTRQSDRVDNCERRSVVAQYQEEVCSVCTHWPAIRSRRCSVSRVCSTRKGCDTPSLEVKPSSSQDWSVRRPSVPLPIGDSVARTALGRPGAGADALP